MDEKDYELLHALDETRNITHAADKLYMTQSALSKRIKALEQELGVEIVLRSRQGIRFTPAGEQVLLHSAAAAREMEKMRRQLASIQGEACGTLRAGISVNFSYYRLPEVLTEYHKAYPKVRLDIATGHSRNIYQQMLDSSLDVAVLRGEYPWDGTQFLLSQENLQRGEQGQAHLRLPLYRPQQRRHHQRPDGPLALRERRDQRCGQFCGG